MTSSEIRQSFLDFFRSKEHTIVPSSSLMPSSPNLLFTNAGMNQFVPYFLGTASAPFDPPRAADTQKCIRAGGKHNDLDDVGLDTYHHTFFEMLGNWSFGNYFKTEAIDWAWELIVEVWGMPAERLYATVYAPAEGDPGEFDKAAWDCWAKHFRKAGLDPDVQIVDGNREDNFWMMGETGPCGPCSELHMDLTPKGDSKGSLVNADSPLCIEIWNLVFIQFNAEVDGSYRPLPACHVDTGMGFERVCAIMQCTDGFQDFSKPVSNYDTDVFTPIFAKLGEISGKTYHATVPKSQENLSETEKVDVAFRVIADHIRTLCFAIGDGILPSNNGRNYVIRRILRRAIRFGRELGIYGGQFFLKDLAPVVIAEFGQTFPELKSNSATILKTLEQEEESFNRTLDRGLKLFAGAAENLGKDELFPAATIVDLWATYGFPLDLTDVLLREKGLAVDEQEVQRLIAEHKETGDDGKQSQTISASQITSDVVSEFVGYETDSCEAKVVEWIEDGVRVLAVVDKSPLYVEMGGQLGDQGVMEIGDEKIDIVDTMLAGQALVVALSHPPQKRHEKVKLTVEKSRRRNIESHHTATHLLHWALHEVVDLAARQQGSLVAPDRLRFDFTSKAVTTEQLEKMEQLVNAKIENSDPVYSREVAYSDVKGREDIMQFFGDKYGDRVRVVQIGGGENVLDGYSMELCGGTHVENLNAVGEFRIKSEGAIAAGIRRIEAVCGDAAREWVRQECQNLVEECGPLIIKLRNANQELIALGESPIEDPDAASEEDDPAQLREFLGRLKDAAANAEKKLKKVKSAQAANQVAEFVNGWIAEVDHESEVPRIVRELPNGSADALQAAMNLVKSHQFDGVAVFFANDGSRVHFGAVVGDSWTGKIKAGDIIKKIAPILGGKGGGKPEMARGAGNDAERVPDAIQAAEGLIDGQA